MSMTQGAPAPVMNGAAPPMASRPPMAPAMPPRPPGAPQPPMGQQPAPSQPQAAPAPPMPTQEVFNAPLFAQAVQLLRDERQKGFRIDVETDSTVALDQQSEQQAAGEMVKAVGAFMQSALPMMQQIPQMVPLMGDVLLFYLRRFPIGVELEGKFEDAIAKLEGLSPASLGGMMSGGAQAGKAQEQQLKQQMLQQQASAAQARTQAELQKSQLEMQSAQQDHATDIATHQMDMQLEQQKAAVAQQRNNLDAAQLAREEQVAQADHARVLEQAAITRSQPLMPQKLPFGQTAK